MRTAERVPTLAPRGVYHLPYYGPMDEVYLVAVDRLGHKVTEAIVQDGQDIRDAEDLLKALLDRADPPEREITPKHYGGRRLEVVR